VLPLLLLPPLVPAHSPAKFTKEANVLGVIYHMTFIAAYIKTC
jgi:hypothetical protein